MGRDVHGFGGFQVAISEISPSVRTRRVWVSHLHRGDRLPRARVPDIVQRACSLTTTFLGCLRKSIRQG